MLRITSAFHVTARYVATKNLVKNLRRTRFLSSRDGGLSCSRLETSCYISDFLISEWNVLSLSSHVVHLSFSHQSDLWQSDVPVSSLGTDCHLVPVSLSLITRRHFSPHVSELTGISFSSQLVSSTTGFPRLISRITISSQYRLTLHHQPSDFLTACLR